MQPNRNVTFTMEAQEWDVVFRALGDMPYRFANPILQKLSSQLQQNEPQAPGAPLNGSGEVTGATHNE